VANLHLALGMVVMWVALALASPFLAYAILFALLGRSFWWIAVPAGLGSLLLLVGLLAWAYASWWLRRVQAVMDGFQETW